MLLRQLPTLHTKEKKYFPNTNIYNMTYVHQLQIILIINYNNNKQRATKSCVLCISLLYKKTINCFCQLETPNPIVLVNL